MKHTPSAISVTVYDYRVKKIASIADMIIVNFSKFNGTLCQLKNISYQIKAFNSEVKNEISFKKRVNSVFARVSIYFTVYELQ